MKRLIAYRVRVTLKLGDKRVEDEVKAAYYNLSWLLRRTVAK